ncbi:Zinc/iron permease [Xylariales sp. PMI_506]|nr:Zinc/iron permease [Xylariales sp. PMI_506]
MDSLLWLRQDAGADDADVFPSVTVECDTGNEFDGRIGVRISSIFVIFVGSLLGSLLPVFLARTSRINVHPMTFFVAKYFGTGVIIATSIMHLLVPAFEALDSPCLDSYNISAYPWAGGICFMTIMVMFLIEILISHYDLFGDGHSHDHAHSADPAAEILKKGSNASQVPPPKSEGDVESGIISSSSATGPERRNSTTGLPGEDHLGHSREHTEDDAAFAAQMTALFILEFGVIFHSVFIGLTLAVSGDEFTILYIVLVFHQTFEGLGLGSRLATASWPRSKSYMPYLLGGLYSLSTPIAIAAGLGVRTTLQPSSPNTLIINGIFDSISAGILLYTGLVELMAHEFMFSPQMRKAGLKMKMSALGCVFLGGGLMALLAEWA